MDPKGKQKLMALFGIFALAALAGYYNLLLRPQFSRFIVNNREYRIVSARVKNGRAMIANETRLRKQFDSLKEQADLLEKKFPGQDEVTGFLEDFSSIAESSGVKILRIKPLESVGSVSAGGAANGFYSEFPILIEARAGYHQCGVFVNKLENMDTFTRIDDIEVRSRFDSGDPHHHDIRLRVRTFITQ